MGLWMSEHTALTRLVLDDRAPIMARCRALQQLEHPELKTLRILLVETKTPRAKPVPAKLKAIATLKYAREMQLKKMRKLKKQSVANKSNPLGII